MIIFPLLYCCLVCFVFPEILIWKEILSDRNSGNCLKVFFSAPLESRIRKVAQRQSISEGEAKATIQKNEKLRADNYRYYTRRMWGAAGNFDLSLNTDLGEEYIENCIRSAMKL